VQAGQTVALIEASDGVGGRVRTDLVDGYRLDRGFQVVLTAYPEVQRAIDLKALDMHMFNPGAVAWIDGQGYELGDPFRDPAKLLETAHQGAQR
jgi:phytoene dehydrogenase-like protein